ncbi:non-ribosomal peptide synthetase [Streptomyces peucetius]|uniref:Amino acid adenylation domain-containing protein n=1 Tax=Streptomyces peucetius TaxID=1950 RepID=A0ABY6I4W4_STRPE|nr:non-ribosomal peptide synthetase [Streptomyces peucetius]UYQ60917.1 amino acid adenylation domain-containing protein [Streptomyces peucetius]
MRTSRLEDVYPLTPLQSGLYFHARLAGAAADLYTAQLTLDLTGPLDPERLARSCATVVRRHAPLRAGFRTRATGDPLQFVVRDAVPPWSTSDLRGVDPEHRAARRERLIAEDRRRPFDLDRPPLVRFRLIRTGDQQWTLVMTNHHLVLDGWSFPVLVREVFRVYTEGGEAAGLPEPAPFRSYLEWLADQDHAEAVAAWRESFEGFDQPAMVASVTAAVPPRHQQLPRTVVSVLPEAGTWALDGLVRGQVTLNTVVQGAWGLLLGWMTGSQDVVLGTVVSGRPPELTGVESMVGLLTNTVPVRVRLDADETVPAYLGRLRDEQARLLPHHHLGLQDLHELTGLPALFDTVTAFENYPVDAATGDELAPGITLTGADIADATHYALTLTVVPGTELEIRLGYQPHLMTAEEARSWLDRLVELLGMMAAGDGSTLRDLVPLLPGEKAELLGRWHGPVRDIPEGTLADGFEAQAGRTPDADAVVFGGSAVSYRELNGRANRLARLLLGRGAGPGRRVALMLPRSTDMVVALLAALKSGAAYIPVDPHLPADRVRFILDDAKPDVVLTTEELLSVVGADVPTVTARQGDDGFRALTEGLSAGNLTEGERPAEPKATDPAWIVYTSGSTGRPKGVVAGHRSVLNRIAWYAAEFPYQPDETVIAKTTLSFVDGSVELLGALLNGARIALADSGTARSAIALAAMIEGTGPCRITVVPSLLGALLEEAGRRDLTSCGLWVSSGEALTLELVRQFRSLLPGARLVNFYGSSEAGADSLYAEADGPEVLLGRPVWNTRTYVLDAWQRPVPVGVVGELHLAGACLADEYLNQSGLTAERFPACPFGNPSDGRMYRTGDLVSRRPDGSLVFHGRVDGQVKIRGFRIEPGEIEAVLAAHPDVQAAVVVDRPDTEGRSRLIAYVVPAHPGRPLDGARLRAHLAGQLPEYMVPALVLPLSEVPLTGSGKIDRKALPAPDFQSASSGRAARTEREELLCGLFAEVLGLDRVTIDDSFFHLGGHSLLATRLIGRIRRELGVEVALRTLYETPTVAHLAETLEERPAAARPALGPMERPEELPLAPVQRRLWFQNRLEGANGNYNMPMALRLTGPLHRAALHRAVNDVVARHESLRTAFPDWDGVPQQVVLEPHEAPVELPLVVTTEEDLPGLLAAGARHPFDLTEETPVQARLFEIGEQEHVLLLVLHHIACDGWSLTPLARDIARAYAASAAGTRPAWSDLAVQYADYTLWAHRLLGGADLPESELNRQTAFWTGELAGLPDRLEIPAAAERPRAPSYRAGHLDARIPVSVLEPLHALAARCGVSLFMVCQAALAALLTEQGAGTDVAIGTPVAGRTDDALDDLVGFFVNTLVLRTRTDGNPTFRELLSRVRTTDLAAYAHQDVPFDHIVQAVNPDREAGRHPLFQVMLAFQNNALPDLSLPGLDVRTEPLPDQPARFDLRFELAERRTADGTPDGIGIRLTYAVDLFTAEAAQELLHGYTVLLERAAGDPESVVGATAGG